jgi:hypothetical protein
MARDVVDESALVDGVVRRTGLSQEEARKAVMVVASELGEALTWGEAFNVADGLSGRPARAMRAAAPTTGGSNRYSPEMFLRIIAERLGSDPAGAEVRVVAVLLTLRDLLPGDRFAAIVEELPNHGALLGGPVAGRNHPEEPPIG